MKYDTVDKDVTKKFLTILNRLKRTCSTYRKNKECQKEIFIRRTLNKYFSKKYFAFIYNEGVGVYKYDGISYCGLSKGYNPDPEREVKIPIKRYAYVGAVSYVLGYGDDVVVSLMFAHSFNPNVKLEFSIRDFLKLEFKEIIKEEFSKVASMFLVDKEELNEEK